MKTGNGVELTFNSKWIADAATVKMETNHLGITDVAVEYGVNVAMDQFEDILNKFSCIPTEYKTLVWQLISRFLREHGYRIVEDGGIVPQ